jgi:hypothetical protein
MSLTAEERELGFVSFHCAVHGFLAAAMPTANVWCRCGKLARRVRNGRLVEPDTLKPTRAKPREPNGTVAALPDLSLARLVKHAEKFGTECVFETAEHVLPEGELRQLDRELTRIEPKRKRVYTALAEEEEHERIIELNKTLSVAEVAKEMKRSQSYVRRVLREAGTPVSPVLSAKARRRPTRKV